MSLPALARTYRHQVNNTVAGNASALTQNKNLLFALVQAELGVGTWTDSDGNTAAHTAKWVHQMSSDSTAVSSVTDKWVTASNIVFNGSSSPRSWRVDYNAAQGVYRLLDCIATGSNGEGLTILTSHVGFGAAHGGADGTTSASPTATASQILLNGGAWGAPVSANLATTIHTIQSTDGKSSRIHLCRGSAAAGHWIFDAAGNPLTGWTHPVIQYVQGSTSAAAEAITYSAFAQATGSTAACFKGVANAGTSIDIAGLPPGATNSGSTGPELYTTLGSISGGYPFFGINLMGRTAGTLEPNLGVCADLFYTITALPTGFQFPGDEVADALRRQFTKFGPWVEPWNKSVAVIT